MHVADIVLAAGERAVGTQAAMVLSLGEADADSVIQAHSHRPSEYVQRCQVRTTAGLAHSRLGGRVRESFLEEVTFELRNERQCGLRKLW